MCNFRGERRKCSKIEDEKGERDWITNHFSYFCDFIVLVVNVQLSLQYCNMHFGGWKKMNRNFISILCCGAFSFVQALHTYKKWNLLRMKNDWIFPYNNLAETQGWIRKRFHSKSYISPIFPLISKTVQQTRRKVRKRKIDFSTRAKWHRKENSE